MLITSQDAIYSLFLDEADSLIYFNLKKSKEANRERRKEEEDFPFFGPSNPKQSPSQSTKQPTGVVNSVRDLHKYSNSGKSDKNEKKDNVVFNSSWKDDIGENKRKASTTQNDDYQKKKELLLQKMKDIDNSESNERSSSGKSQKDYKFSEPVENLHHGRPSHPEVNLSPRSSRKNQSNFTTTNGRRTSKEDIDVDEITFGSYAPSFSKPKDVNQEKQAVKPSSVDSNSLDSNDRNVRSSFGVKTSSQHQQKPSQWQTVQGCHGRQIHGRLKGGRPSMRTINKIRYLQRLLTRNRKALSQLNPSLLEQTMTLTMISKNLFCRKEDHFVLSIMYITKYI
ncbi:putative lebercilin [Apostichopus japonicus]|uniref:Putative lebercilin n=1 Tax=Stichopus japonicus TaxID=307972 RepID=A0A2G8L9N9_STIJA|nr:putative lebercilin [Apostichopus japonicus]